MQNKKNWLAGLVGVGCGLAVALLLNTSPKAAVASSSDRYQDYIMCTGAVSVNPKVPTDGVWMLDYRGGRKVPLGDELRARIEALEAEGPELPPPQGD